MNVHYYGPDSKRLTDNEIEVFNIIVTILNFSDPDSTIYLYREENKIIGHISISNQERREEVISNLLFLNRVLKIKIIYSKSLSVSKKISFEIFI